MDTGSPASGGQFIAFPSVTQFNLDCVNQSHKNKVRFNSNVPQHIGTGTIKYVPSPPRYQFNRIQFLWRLKISSTNHRGWRHINGIQKWRQTDIYIDDEESFNRNASWAATFLYGSLISVQAQVWLKVDRVRQTAVFNLNSTARFQIKQVGK